MAKKNAKMSAESKRRFNRKLKALAKFIKPNKGFSKLLAGMGTDIIRRSSRRVPVDTGTLKQSVFLEGKPFSIVVGYNANYSRFVEEGTSKMKAKPFFEPSIKESIKRFKDNWSVQIQKEYRK
tara:strand:- start:3079 stop:3447 length:369 start_codon:yes stop_codon:yes gene_type:complete